MSKVDLTAYASSFLALADPLRAAIEPMSDLATGVPRFRNSAGGKVCWQLNTEDEVATGRKAVCIRRSYGGELGNDTEYRYPLRRFRPGMLKRHIRQRKCGVSWDAATGSCSAASGAKMWLFMKYYDEADFIRFDHDRHYHRDLAKYEQDCDLPVDPTRTGLTPEDKGEIDAAFFEEVRLVRDLFEELGATVLVTGSPGNLLDGEHVRGAYTWIKLDRTYPVEQLVVACKALKKAYGITSECSWDRPGLNIRLPGQQYVELCDPETLQPLQPVKKKMESDLACFADAWNNATPVSLAAIQERVATATASTTNMPVVNEHVVVGLNPAVSEQPSFDKALMEMVVDHRRQREFRNDEDYIGRMRATVNPFIRQLLDRTCSIVTHKYCRSRGDFSNFDRAVAEAKVRLTVISPFDSETCGNPVRLDATMRRWLRWYFNHFDAAKRRGSSNEEDHNRIAYSLGLDRARVLRATKSCGLTYKEKGHLSAFLDLVERYNGRVSVKLIYDGERGFCEKSAWFRLLRKVTGVLDVVVEHDQHKHKCRQWALNPALVTALVETMERVEEILKEEEKKKRERVYAQPCRRRYSVGSSLSRSSIMALLNAGFSGQTTEFAEIAA